MRLVYHNRTRNCFIDIGGAAVVRRRVVAPGVFIKRQRSASQSRRTPAIICCAMIEIAKSVAKRLLPGALQAQIRAVLALDGRLDRLEKQVLILAGHQSRQVYGSRNGPSQSRSTINDHELQIYSQNGEDGILQFIFAQIGVTSRTFVEFGMGDGRECNTAYLSLQCGWRGLLMDGNTERVAVARAFYNRVLGSGQDAVRIEEAWISAENINDLLRQHTVPGGIDLLSIDMDGNDYWVWQAVDATLPRVIVIEYSAVLGWERACTTPYDPRFVRWEKHPSGLYAGASLAALTKLGAAKGYRLVGCNRHGVNAFFVREDCAPEALPAVSPEQAYYPCDDRILGWISPERFSEVSHLDYEDV